MKLLLLMCLIALAAAKNEKKDDPRPNCDSGVKVSGIFHKREILAKGLDRPYQLSYSKTNHEIHFSYNIGKDSEDKFEVGVLEHNATEPKAIVEVNNGFATAIDEEHQIAYYGGSEGIYRKSLKPGGGIHHIIKNHNIWDMFFKKHLYFITYPSQKLYKFSDDFHKTPSKHPDHQNWIHEKIYQFVIDGDDDVFITNETGLYIIKNDTKHRTLLKGEKLFRAIEVNNKGVAHFCGKHSINVPFKDNHTLIKIADIKNIFGLTFDSDDHIIYSDPHEIVKLLPSECSI